jgi:UDP-N-acetylmuramoylalanine--D-glutamate ligase
VVEMSSFQLEGTDRFHPWIAVFLNLSADHLDRHGSLAEYAAAKARIFANQTAADWAVVNADDPAVLALAALGRARQLRFGLDAPPDDGIAVAGGWVVERAGGRDTPLVPLAAVRLLGRHLLSDVLAAVAVARLAGVPPAAMTRALEAFAGLEHALEPVAEIASVRFVNDSKATNIEAARRAIESFGAGLVPILGGRFKGGDFRSLRAALAERTTAVVAIGEAQALIREALDDLAPVYAAISLGEAVRIAFRLAPPGGAVLLAPACASFDMFRDYAERGRRFKEEVARLAEEVRGTPER